MSWRAPSYRRWWRSAALFTVLNVVTLIVGVVTTMSLIIGLSSLPFWSFNVIAALVFGLVVPHITMSFALISCDRAAELDVAVSQPVEPICVSSTSDA